MTTTRKAKVLALLCAVVMALSMLPALPAMAISGSYTTPDMQVFHATSDLSIMSFNILVGKNANYDTQATRFTNICETIDEYDPDIFCVQEASNAYSGSDGFDWEGNLKSHFTAYTGRSVNNITGVSMTVVRGLIIFYKTARFTRLTEGATAYNLSYTPAGGSEQTPSVGNERYYQYVKLRDTTHGNIDFYVYNTHFPINPDINDNGTNQDAVDIETGKAWRTQAAAQIAASMSANATGMPCFATGDFNCTLEASNADPDANDAMLTKISNGTPFRDSGAVTKCNYPESYTSIIDHVFVNSNFTDVLARDVVFRTYGGRATSDHKPVIIHTNYKAAATWPSGAVYDAQKKTLTASTSGTEYDLDATFDDAGFSYEIYDEDDVEVNSPLTLTKPVNHFTLKLYNSTAVPTGTHLFDTVDVTINSSSSSIATPGAITCTGAHSAYYNKTTDAYYISVSKATTSVTPAIVGATLYSNAACTSAQATPVSLSDGRKTIYAKIGNAVYPLYIDRETDGPASGTLYVDASLAGLADGKKGAYHETYNYANTVRIVTVGTNGFATLSAAVSKATSGATIYVAPGTYNIGTTSVSADKNLTIIGHNHDYSPKTPDSSVWIPNNRREAESILNGQIRVTQSGSTGSITVIGFKFTGTTSQGPFFSNVNGTDKTTEYNLSKNIFCAVATNTTNGSQIILNPTSQKTGVIKDNWFGSFGEDIAFSKRAIQYRNSNGLVIADNYFYMYNSIWASSEVQDRSIVPGYNTVTFTGNRFAGGGFLYLSTPTVTAATEANIRFLCNDFVRCGFSSEHPVSIYMQESDQDGAPDDDYSKVNIEIFGNNFEECARGIGIYRTSLTGIRGDLTDASIEIHNNRFCNTGWSFADQDIRFYTYAGADDTEFNIPVTWSASHNYFYSATVTSTDPADHILLSNDSGTPFITSLTTAPYFTDSALSTLNTGSLSTLGAVSVTTNTYTYDGNPHPLVLSMPEGCNVLYSTNNGNSWSAEVPERTNAGTTSIKYQVEKEGYASVTGTVSLTINKATISDVTIANSTAAYDSTPKSLTLSGAHPSDFVLYRYGGTNYYTMPSFTVPGTYDISGFVQRENYDDLMFDATLTITNATITGVTLPASKTLTYNGSNQIVEPTGTEEGDTVTYSIDGGSTYSAAPAMCDAGNYTLKAKIQRTYYDDLVLTCSVTMNPAPIPNGSFYVLGYTGLADGNNHGVRVFGAEEGDTVTYSTDGSSYSAVVPTFSAVGVNTVYVKLERDNYVASIATAKVELSNAISAPLFELTEANFVIRNSVVSPGRKSLEWTYAISGTDAFDSSEDDIKVLSYGMLYSTNIDDLTTYVYNEQHDLSNSSLASTVIEYPWRESDIGLTQITSTFSFSFNKIKQNKSRAVVAYIRYEVDGELYTDYSTVSGGTTILDGYINGINDPIEENDPLDD